MHEDDIQALLAHCRDKLDLASIDLPQSYGYQSLPLCVIDAVFSIKAKSSSTQNVVFRFCKALDLIEFSAEQPPPVANQLSITDFVKLHDQLGADEMATRVYSNQQRTSPNGGILKAVAAYRFAQVLQQFGVDYFQDIHKALGNPAFEWAIQAIPGQKGGKSLRDFYRLAGYSDEAKPDRTVLQFVESAIHRAPGVEECHDALIAASGVLATEHPHLTPRTLDNLIWKYQRAHEADKAKLEARD